MKSANLIFKILLSLVIITILGFVIQVCFYYFIRLEGETLKEFIVRTFYFDLPTYIIAYSLLVMYQIRKHKNYEEKK